MPKTTSVKPFGEEARDLMFTNPALLKKNLSPNWKKLSLLSEIEYESLRKAISGERLPSDKIMRAVAKALNVRPEHFIEYQANRAREQFDPKVVGLEAALQNLALFEAERERAAEGDPDPERTRRSDLAEAPSR
jgi:hypothetical protein